MVESKRMTICVGDLHGHLDRLRDLWRNLERKLGAEAFRSATVIFLGDYNDRGPDTKGVLDFLVSLPQRYPEQRHVFLCGNHDFAFAAFLGVLPTPPSLSTPAHGRSSNLTKSAKDGGLDLAKNTSTSKFGSQTPPLSLAPVSFFQLRADSRINFMKTTFDQDFHKPSSLSEFVGC
jgi:hypothetical protein